jgi:hypothetical protein
MMEVSQMVIPFNTLDSHLVLCYTVLLLLLGSSLFINIFLLNAYSLRVYVDFMYVKRVFYSLKITLSPDICNCCVTNNVSYTFIGIFLIYKHSKCHIPRYKP